MRIIAFDPGYQRLGIAIIERNQNSQEELVFSECFETSKDTEYFERIHQVGIEVERIIKKYSPEIGGIEGLFFSKNTKTALKVSEIRGVLIYLCKKNKVPIYEFTPNQIKVAVTGHGQSDKKSVQDMVSRLINLPDRKIIDDEIDAIACGLTLSAHYNTII
jgi:crossover junction endodeoxyribonuclease RuvC